MSALLHVDKLSVCYKKSAGGLRDFFGMGDELQILDGVSLEVNSGELYAIVGESGSGKTTLIRAIGGLAPISGGSARFDGRELRTLPAAQWRGVRKDMAMMFQDPTGSLSPRLSVGSLLAEPYRIHGVKKADLAAEVKRLLTLVGLRADFADKYPHQLSGGQARRVGVARALALEPKLILADEPTAGLDVSVQGELLNLLNRLRDTLGLAMLVITHNLNVVRHIADKMGVMYLGRLVEEGAAEEVFTRPLHPYTLCLLSANPEPDPDAQQRRIALRGEPPGVGDRPSGCEFRLRCPFMESPLCEQVPPWSVMESAHGVRCLRPMTEEARP